MGELIDRDHEHLRLLTLGYYVMAGTTAFFSLFSLIYIAIGGVFASGVIPLKEGSRDPDPRVMGLVFLGIGFLVLLLGLGVTLLTYLTARHLKGRRHRLFCLIIAGFSCLQVPWGTAIGVCTFAVLNRPSVKALFAPVQPTNPA